jgi:hypothetical protein
VLLVTLLLKNVLLVPPTELIHQIVYVQPVPSIPKLKNQSVKLVLKDVLLVHLVKLVLLVLQEELTHHIVIVQMDNGTYVGPLLLLVVIHLVLSLLVLIVTIPVKPVLDLQPDHVNVPLTEFNLMMSHTVSVEMDITMLTTKLIAHNVMLLVLLVKVVLPVV